MKFVNPAVGARPFAGLLLKLAGSVGMTESTLLAAVAVIARWIFRIRPKLINIRWRKVNREFDAVRLRGPRPLRELRRPFRHARDLPHRMRRVARRPQAEAVVVFADEHNHRDPLAGKLTWHTTAK